MLSSLIQHLKRHVVFLSRLKQLIFYIPKVFSDQKHNFFITMWAEPLERLSLSTDEKGRWVPRTSRISGWSLVMTDFSLFFGPWTEISEKLAYIQLIQATKAQYINVRLSLCLDSDLEGIFFNSAVSFRFSFKYRKNEECWRLASFLSQKLLLQQNSQPLLRRAPII